MSKYNRPPLVRAWMLGYYAALVAENKALSDVSLWDLDPRYLDELYLRAKREMIDGKKKVWKSHFESQ